MPSESSERNSRQHPDWKRATCYLEHLLANRRSCARNRCGVSGGGHGGGVFGDGRWGRGEINITVTPGFAEPLEWGYAPTCDGDFHITNEASACLDAGSVALALALDFDGKSRPIEDDGTGQACPDMGAYEYGAGPPAPTDCGLVIQPGGYYHEVTWPSAIGVWYDLELATNLADTTTWTVSRIFSNAPGTGASMTYPLFDLGAAGFQRAVLRASP